MRVFLVDDEGLALKRLTRLLGEFSGVEVVGQNTDPVFALEEIGELRPDLLFLDIEMPGLSGFELLAQLETQPLVVFTTAFDQYALRAFGVNSVDYLLKPIEAAHLERALNKIGRIRAGAEPRTDLTDLLAKMTKAYPERISSKLGERVEFVELARVSHFYASDKLTYAATAQKDFVIDYTIQDLEQRLDPKNFVRIHRGALINVSYVHELHTWFAGRMMVRLKDEKRTELTVARDRVRVLKEKLGL